jgi:hypothetical protein
MGCGSAKARVEAMMAVGSLGEWPDPVLLIALDKASFDWGTTAHACLRFIRIAAPCQATGEVLDLEDPRGDRMNISRTGQVLRAWSGGGSGAKDPSRGDGWRYGQDLLIEVGR